LKLIRLDSQPAKAVDGATRARLKVYAHSLASLPPHRAEARALLGWLVDHADVCGITLPAELCRQGMPKSAINPMGWARVREMLKPRGRKAAAPRPFARLATTLGLDALEEGMLQIVADYGTEPAFETLWDAVAGACGYRPWMAAHPRLFALILGVAEGQVRKRLHQDSPLRAAGLLIVGDDRNIGLLPRLLNLANDPAPRSDLRGALIGPAVSSALPFAAFAHLGASAQHAVDLLRGALGARETGIHILLYGPPGTGKTAFAAALAAEAGAPLHEVAMMGSDGEELAGRARLAELCLVQRLAIGGGPTLLLLDEAEDVFDPGYGMFGQTARGGSRAFMHRLLETSVAPVIWTANNLEQFGPAVLRRMSCCLELRVPPLPVRAQMLSDAAARERVALPPGEAMSLARMLPSSPGIMRNAMRTARLAGGGGEIIRWAVAGVAAATAGGRVHLPDAASDRFDPSLVSADIDLAALAMRLAQPSSPRRVSLLLSGPPGSGKSAYARHLADAMGLAVLQMRGSDLFGPYVGQTEQQIAAAFAEARDSGAMLVFDEADSLLGAREGAQRSWEVSQVNEMLTWMEQHPLPFCCTTNLAERLDAASMRRFLVKARFGWLSAAQAELAWRRVFDVPPPAALRSLDRLTPADFTLVRRGAEIDGSLGDSTTLLAALTREQGAKPGASKPIGFLTDKQ
jgi:transitional endoplasmic reticulum ATPase